MFFKQYVSFYELCNIKLSARRRTVQEESEDTDFPQQPVSTMNGLIEGL